MRRGILAIALAVGMICGVGCQRGEEQYEKPLTPVRVAAVQEETAVAGIRYAAVIEPNTRVDVAFKGAGYIADILEVTDGANRRRIVQDGDRVAKGDTLARIRDTDYIEKVNQARSQLAEAVATAEQAKQSFDRAKQLFASASLTKPDLEAAEAAFQVTQAKLSGARALVQEAENALADCALRAPLDGVVMKRLVEVGSLVGPGTPGFVIADVSTVKVVFGAPDVMVRELVVGSEQAITTEALSGTVFRGRITRIAPLADPKSGVFDVEVSIPNVGDRLKVGMVAALQVSEPGDTVSALAVPLTAIIKSKEQPDGYAVFVIQDQQGKQIARLQNVTLGAALGNRIAVSQGLRAGERVIVNGATLVTDGEQVRVVS